MNESGDEAKCLTKIKNWP